MLSGEAELAVTLLPGILALVVIVAVFALPRSQGPVKGARSGRLSTALANTREYLRDLSELPTASVKQFNSELEKVGTTNRRKRTGQGKRTRAARAKD